MIGRVVEVAGAGRYLSLDRGFLVVNHGGGEVARTPIDDIAALIGNGHGLSYSNNLLVALAERGCPFVLCGANHRPVAMLWPVESHHRQAARMDAQLAASLPMRKRLWKQVVQAKIGMQAAVVDLFDGPPAPLLRMVRAVRAGDPSNVEGQAARLYWSQLFGGDFRRRRHGGDQNLLLNYGYTILRATVARQLMAAGLHPGIPLHHANEGNSMRLVDDLMEPFRPLVDAWVRRLWDGGQRDLTPLVKRALARLPVRSLHVVQGVSPVTIVIQRLCVSLAQCYEAQAKELVLPPPGRDVIASLWDDEHDETERDAETS
ncbi:MAG: type II CRISPR-associated endonuclease Cas1 [Chromatiales bacterium]|nr:type II CRISPR-associated endonuclease Cas1 [Chromatiales bacterium]